MNSHDDRTDKMLIEIETLLRDPETKKKDVLAFIYGLRFKYTQAKINEHMNNVLRRL